MRFNVLTLSILVLTVLQLHAQFTWKPLLPPIGSSMITAFDTGSDGTLYVVSGARIFFSKDEGNTWERVERVPYIDDGYRFIVARGANGGDSLIVYQIGTSGARSWWNTPLTAIWNERSWPKINTEAFCTANGRIVSFAVDTVEHVANFLQSTDRGRTWIAGRNIHSEVAGMIMDGKGDAILSFNENQGIVRRLSPDGTWSPLQVPGRVLGIVSSRDMIVARTPDAIYRSVDGGEVWTLLNDGFTFVSMTSDEDVQSMAILPDGGIIAITNQDRERCRVQYLASGTTEWVTSASDLPMTLTRPYAISSSRILAMGSSVAESGTMISEDNGKTWTPSEFGLNTIAIPRFAIDGSTVVASFGGGELYRGDLKTGRWERQIMPFLLPFEREFSTFDIVALGDGVFLALTNVRFFRSVDSGRTWVARPLLQNAYGLRFVQGGSGVLYMLTEHTIMASNNGGITWDLVYYYQPRRITILSMAERTPSHFIIGADSAVFEYHAGAEMPLTKVWDTEFAPDIVSRGSGADLRMAIVNGNDPLRYWTIPKLYCLRPDRTNIHADPERYQSELGTGTPSSLLGRIMAPNGDVYITTTHSMWRLLADDTDLHEFPNGDDAQGIDLQWSDIYGLVRSTDLGRIECAVGPAVSVAETRPEGAGVCTVHPNPATARVTVHTTQSAGTATVDIVDMMGRAVSASQVDIVDGEASLDVSGLLSGPYRLSIRTDVSMASTSLVIVR